MAKKVAKTAKSKKAPKKTAEELRKERVKKNHIRSARNMFRSIGFDRIPEIANEDITFKHQSGEFDDAFILENLILLVEYTTFQSDYITDHLKKKKIIFSNIIGDPQGFFIYLKDKFEDFKNRVGDKHHIHRYIFKIIYCSLNDFDDNVKKVVDEPKYLDFPILKYFEIISNTIKMSALNEFLHFIDVQPERVAKDGVFVAPELSAKYKGSILPEAFSGFPPGYKIVSFYADPASLLDRAYVLRRQGWRASSQAYQRMLIKKKVEAIRSKLRADKRTFVNNLVATLPHDVQPILADGQTTSISDLIESEPIKIDLPLRANSIGIIDGQHRLYSYYRSKNDDDKIAKLRSEQNLLVTGIIYPKEILDSQKESFEAELFLAINSNQTNAGMPLKQELRVLLNPYDSVAIGRQVISLLSKTGPLSRMIEEHFFQKGGLKTSSIVSFGLSPLVKMTGDDSIFCLFEHKQKAELVKNSSDKTLGEYVEFCAKIINLTLGAIRKNVAKHRWTTEKTVPDRIVSVTAVNAFLILLRRLIQNKKAVNFDTLDKCLQGLNAFNFGDFHSSQYADMADKLYEKYFS